MHTHIVVLSSFLIRRADYNVDHIENGRERKRNFVSLIPGECELRWIYQFWDFEDTKILLDTHTTPFAPLKMRASMKATKLNAKC